MGGEGWRESDERGVMGEGDYHQASAIITTTTTFVITPS